MKSRSNPHLILMLAALVILRGFIPVGFMPDIEALKKGEIDIVMCTGIGFSTIHIDDSDQSPSNSSADHNTHTICPFLSLMVTALLLAIVVSLLGLQKNCLFVAMNQFYRRSYRNRLTPPRGPPLLA